MFNGERSSFCVLCQKWTMDAGWFHLGWCCSNCWHEYKVFQFHGPIDNNRIFGKTTELKRSRSSIIKIDTRPVRSKITIEEIEGEELI